MLSYDKDWEALIVHYEEKGCLVEGDTFCGGAMKAKHSGCHRTQTPYPGNLILQYIEVLLYAS